MTDDNKKTSQDPAPAAENGGDAAPASAPAPKTTRFDIPTVAIAAVLGAVLAIALQFGLAATGLWPGGSGTGGAVTGEVDLGPLERRVSALERTSGTSTDVSDAAVAELRQSFARLRDQVARLEARAPEGGTDVDLSAFTDSIDALDAELRTFAARLATLEGRTPEDLRQQLAGFAPADDLATLDARLGQLEADFERNDARRAALGLGVAQLARAAGGSRPFAEELAAVSLLRPNDTLIARLAPVAEEGVPTLAMLQADFPRVARQVARAAQTPEQQTAWGQVWTWLGQFVSFRRTGDTEGEAANAILARAELRLSEGDLGAAVDEMNSLPEGAAAPADDWMAAAEARVALDAAITVLSSEIITELGEDR